MSNRIQVSGEGFNELCAEILENWMRPNRSKQYLQTLAKQNPFSLHNQNHFPQFHTADEPHHIREDRSDSTLEIMVNEDDLVLSPDLNEMEEKNMKAGDADKVFDHERSSEKSSQHEKEKEISDDRTEKSILPFLVMDTFYDRVLKRASDGIDIEALLRVDNTTTEFEANDKLKMRKNEKNAGASTARDNINLDQKASQLKYNSLVEDRMENPSPVFGKRKRKVSPSTEAHREMSSYPVVGTERKDINLDQKSFQLQKGLGNIMASGSPISSNTRYKAVSSVEANQEIISYPTASTDRKDTNLDQMSFLLKGGSLMEDTMARGPPISSEIGYKADSSNEAHRDITSYPGASTDRKDINRDQKPFELQGMKAQTESGSTISGETGSKEVSSIEAHPEITSYPAASTDWKFTNLDQKSAHSNHSSLMEDRMASSSPIYSKTRCKPASSIEAQRVIASYPAANQLSMYRKRESYVPNPNKTIFDTVTKLDRIKEKKWRNPGADISDFFNYGMDENKWREYCRLLEAHFQMGTSAPSKITASHNKSIHKEATADDMVRLDIRTDTWKRRFRDPGVIIDVSTLNKNRHMKEHRNKGAMKYGARDTPVSENHYTNNTISTMIDANKPFPADNNSNNSTRDRMIYGQYGIYGPYVEQSLAYGVGMQQQHNMANCNGMVSAVGYFHDMGKQQVSRNQGVNPTISELNSDRIQFNMGNQISHGFLGNVTGYSYFPEPNESAKKKNEYCGSEEMKKEHVAGILPKITNNHDVDPKQELEHLDGIKIADDPETLKRRLDKFKLLPVKKKVQADESMVSETNSSPPNDTEMKDSDYSPPRPIRRRKWNS